MSESDDQKLAGQLKLMLGQCVGYQGDELQNARKDAYDYYFQRPRGDEIEGRSEIVSGDVSAMVEGNLAMMVQPLIVKRIVDFCAYSEKDEEQAQLEADCVREMIFERENGFIEVTCAIKDALLLRNCPVKVYVDERTHTSRIRRTGVSPEVVTFLVDKMGDVDIHKYDPESGELSVTVRKTTRKFRVESLAPENLLLPKNWHRQDLENIPFLAERHVEPRSTLVERGFPKEKVAKLRAWNNPYNTGSESRLPYNVTPNYKPIDKSQELVEWYECYAMMDDGNGGAMLHVIAMSGTTILEDDTDATMITYAIGTAIVNPHTWIGISLFDKLKGTQDSSTALNRALMDNVNATNKARTAHFDEVVEESDLLDGRINNSIRVKPGIVPDVRMAITAFQVPDTTGNLLANIEHQRKTRSEMGGATLDMATGQMQMSDRLGSQGLDRAYSVMEQLAQFMMLVLAHTLIRNMYKVAHEVLRTSWQEPIKFKRGKEWVATNPADWPVRESVKVNIGKALNERARLSGVLDALMAKQMLLAQAGMEDILVDVQAFYNTLIDWLRINDVEIPERYLLDPRSDKAVKAFKQKATQRAEAARKQEGLLQQGIALEQLRVAFEKYKQDSDLQFKYWETIMTTQVDEAKIAGGAVADIVKAQFSATQAREKNAANKGNGSAPAGDSGSSDQES